MQPPGFPDACATGSVDACAAATSGNGYYCGLSLGADAGKLYQCQNGVTVSAQSCPSGCQINAAGTADVCAGGDPCASASSGDGAYCGQSLTNGDVNTLYTCSNGATAGRTSCPNGCRVNLAGTADACEPGGTDPCSGVSSNGDYCGSSLALAAADSLYTCVGQATASVTACTNGCLTHPAGTPDQCAPSTGGGCCVNRPPGVLWGSFSACGGGGEHYGIDYGASIGTPLYAGISGTVSFRTGYGNCYDASTQDCSNACYNSDFNYLRIQADCGDPLDALKDIYVYYLHVDRVASGLRDGQHVDQGEYVADVGNSGCSSAPHTHLEVVVVPRGQSPALHSCSSADPASRYCN